MSIRPIWSKPTLVSEWEHDEQEERETYWTSLFYDLILVAGVSAISDPFSEKMESGEGASEHHHAETSEALLVSCAPLVENAILQFFMLTLPWSYLNEYTSTFQDESLVAHMAFFVHLFGFATTAAGCVGELETNYHHLAIGIIITNIGLMFLYLGPYIHIEKARSHLSFRMITAMVIIVITFFFTIFDKEEEDFESFRLVLYFIIVWSIVCHPLVVILKSERLRLHVAHFTDRWKELTMIIFGEAIFSITLEANSSKDWRYYIALLITLWIIFSLALTEFDLFPQPDDHALRRSLKFAILWNFTMIAKTIFLLGTSIGIKRAHSLVWGEQEHIDADTRSLLIWGTSLTLFSVVLVRSYSFGYGRHPGPNDEPKLVFLKLLWWSLTSILAIGPLLMQGIISLLGFEPSPFVLLILLGVLLKIIVLVEAILSNTAAKMTNVELKSGDNYLGSTTPRYGSIPTHESMES